MVVFKLNHFAALLGPTVALNFQVMVKQSREIDRNFLSDLNRFHSDNLILTRDGVRIAGMRHRSPVPRVAIPEISPCYLLVVMLDPVKDDDLLAHVLLIVDNLPLFNCFGCS